MKIVYQFHGQVQSTFDGIPVIVFDGKKWVYTGSNIDGVVSTVDLGKVEDFHLEGDSRTIRNMCEHILAYLDIIDKRGMEKAEKENVSEGYYD